MSKIIDCFMFWNEIEILLIRLDILYDYVDHFIICESKRSHSGKVVKDEYTFLKNKFLFKKYLDKIIFLPLPENKLIGTGDNSVNQSNGQRIYKWSNENYQRQYLFNEITKFHDNTFVAISDVDEIWDPSNIAIIKKNVEKYKVCGIEQKLFYYYLNCMKTQLWKGTYFIQKKNLNFDNIDAFRDARTRLPSYVNGGWHFSWMGDVDKIKEKFNCIAEHDIISDFSNTENIIQSLKECKDLFNRQGYLGEFTILQKDSPLLPSNMDKYIKMYPFLLK